VRTWWYAADGGLVFQNVPAPLGEPEWHQMPAALREMEEAINAAWTRDLDAFEALRVQDVAGKPHVKGFSPKPSNPAGTAGPVTVRSAYDSYQERAYTAVELREIEQQGKLAPRLLNLVESRLATWNRKEQADLSRWLERTLPYARG
jgi:hypothetical protein